RAVEQLFDEIATACGTEAACQLFKKYGNPAGHRRRRDAELLWLYYRMENPKKRTLAKQIDPENWVNVEAQLKRALKHRRYVRLREYLTDLATSAKADKVTLDSAELRNVLDYK